MKFVGNQPDEVVKEGAVVVKPVEKMLGIEDLSNFNTETSQILTEEEDPNVPKKKKVKKWVWSANGEKFAYAVMLLSEIIILTGSLWLLVPFSLNVPFTFINAFSASVLLNIVRKWWKE